jgi:hypothetical protein
LKERKKIRYIPGIFTIVALPLLSIYYLRSIGAFIQYRAIEINLPNHTQKNQVFEFKTINHFIVFKLSNDETSNEMKITQIDSLLLHLKAKNDTVNGIHIIFENQVKYNFFIQTLNLLIKHAYITYLIDDGDIWTMWNSPVTKDAKEVIDKSIDKKESTYVNCGTQELIYRQQAKDYHSLIIKKRELLFLSNLKALWIVLAAYIILVGISMLNLWRFERK